ncbi:MAG: IS21 family transposase [Thermodesulfobacteriota bacterium]|nr:IS21 family transposase [Thermodesulfobacteriota bacterium]
MIDYETYVQIRNHLDRDKLKYNQIAEKLALDHRTVARWAKEKRYQPRQSSRRPSKLDPFKNDITRMLDKHNYSAAQIFQQLKEDGFTGGYSIVKAYVRQVRPRRIKAYLTLHFAPGECAQVDWGNYGSAPVGSTRRRLSFFVMVLCHSRMMYVEFTVLQTMEHFLACHQNAFNFFGGVPKKIMVDNLKSAVLKRIVGQDPYFNPRYLDFADHYGFKVAACGVGKGNEKGRVESGVGYVKKNLLAGLDISDFKIMKPVTQHWLDNVANIRRHGETGRKPIDMLPEDQKCLQPVHPEPYDVGVIKQARASKMFRITIDANRYSVPAELAGRRVTVKQYPDRICIYNEDKLVARHVRSYDRRQDIEDPDHPKELLAHRKKARDQTILIRFLRLSDRAEEYYRQLDQRRLNTLHHIRQIVALSEIYSPDQVQRAIADAFTFNAFSCEYIANLLEQRARPVQEPKALHLTRRSDLLELTITRPDLNIYNHSIKE